MGRFIDRICSSHESAVFDVFLWIATVYCVLLRAFCVGGTC